MDIDLDRLAGDLNEAAKQIKEASSKPAQEALPFVPKIMEQFQNLPSPGDLRKEMNVEACDTQKLENVYNAIQDVITNTKEAQEHFAPLGASLLDPLAKEMSDLSELVVKYLKQKGKRVERKEQEGL
ncbi:MAG: hypothetical protein K940chlam7_00679 [Chlamydiae bacterium]|nr:hypothetical protein [Chlamydiota bacterium]